MYVVGDWIEGNVGNLSFWILLFDHFLSEKVVNKINNELIGNGSDTGQLD